MLENIRENMLVRVPGFKLAVVKTVWVASVIVRPLITDLDDILTDPNDDGQFMRDALEKPDDKTVLGWANVEMDRLEKTIEECIDAGEIQMATIHLLKFVDQIAEYNPSLLHKRLSEIRAT